MSSLPSGTVTFLFTDIEGSTKLWELHREAMARALARHDVLMRQTIGAHGGHVFKAMGDAFCAVFPKAKSAVECALQAQRVLGTEPWGEVGRIKVRMALHTGEAEERDGDYFGSPLNRSARLLSAGYGQQVLLSQATASLVRDALPDRASLKDLGLHRLRDLVHPEQILQ